MKHMFTYFERHAQAFIGSLGALARTPLATLMTVAVIGITLSLPAVMFVAIDNALRVSSGWEGPARVSVFMKQRIDNTEAQQLAERLRRRSDVAKVDVISRDQAFEEFKRYSGLGESLRALEHNPLPIVLVVHPSASMNDAVALEGLAQELERADNVELAQLDLEWVKRLHAWLSLLQRGVRMLGGLLALAVLLIIGNTIRLAVLSRRDEIEVSKLVGATDAFIRRPFLYSGVAQAVLGATLAWVLVQVSLLVLSGPVNELTGLYGASFRVNGLGVLDSGILFGSAAVLGWGGARFAVSRHLRAIEPK
jgi:cell division transport system permease protein